MLSIAKLFAIEGVGKMTDREEFAARMPSLVLNVTIDRNGDIRLPRLPGAIFSSVAALKEHAPDRRTYEKAVAGHAQEVAPANVKRRVKAARAAGYAFVTAKSIREDAEWELRSQLEALNYSDAEVRWHIANPGRRDRHAYSMAADLSSLAA
jgi:hypothetical protein